MAPAEIALFTQVASELGVRRVKITGGEPLLREDITEIVHRLAKIDGIDEVSLVTNATLLTSRLAKELRDRGLARVNISLPSTDAETYRNLTKGEVSEAIRGVEAAVAAGLFPTKLNMVVVGEVNEREISSMIEFARRLGTVLQLIELEPVNIDPKFYSEHRLPLDLTEKELRDKSISVVSRRYMQNRRVYSLPGVQVEVVRPVENTEFCSHCARIRLTSDGRLKPCLMRNDNLVDLLGPLRSGRSEEYIRSLFRRANELREPFFKESRLE